MRKALTRAQAHAMTRVTGLWQTAKDLGVSVNTADAMVYRGVLEKTKLGWNYLYRRKHEQPVRHDS